MIVVDSTVLGDLLYNGDLLRASAQKLQQEDPEWICLELVRYELGNIATKYGLFQAADIHALMDGLEGADEVVSEFVSMTDWKLVLEIAIKDRLSFYDASHVWLARARGLTLRTRDKEILRKCPDVALPMPVVS